MSNARASSSHAAGALVRLAALVLAGAALLGCGVDRRSDAYRCDTAGASCSDGRECMDGWCVVPAGTGCPAVCTSCDGATCQVSCLTEDGCADTVVCPEGMNCEVSCGGAGSCAGGVDCDGAVSCQVLCSGASACAGLVACGAGACNVNCEGDESCAEGIDCSLSCACDTDCDGDNACPEVSCPDRGGTCTRNGECRSNGCDVC
ncbi:hypothetical protein [Haliangium ochraceum]|uniref:Uncharacterized protein n=1 Tax=Haliangium ochraceum (strain DSM 14365 / JCM 11303 / SMP-2) TaxID=502025 RepID=D0LJ77_HALO1|nr:hypothetical protein [Haliangium ochraceum]ACY14924.1 hypothetical protein Hoch_2387 [Haliangium ochraceum DSM 14365]